MANLIESVLFVAKIWIYKKNKSDLGGVCSALVIWKWGLYCYHYKHGLLRMMKITLFSSNLGIFLSSKGRPSNYLGFKIWNDEKWKKNQFYSIYSVLDEWDSIQPFTSKLRLRTSWPLPGSHENLVGVQPFAKTTLFGVPIPLPRPQERWAQQQLNSGSRLGLSAGSLACRGLH